MRKFEIISRDQFHLDMFEWDWEEENRLYENILIPKRHTKNSAGYDIRAVGNHSIFPGESLKIPTGLKVCMENDEFLMLFIRSSLGVKHNIRLNNSVGIIDSDYYNNVANEGHFWITIYNAGGDIFEIKDGDRVVQGIFTKYLTTDDDDSNEERKGGFGSTDKEEK